MNAAALVIGLILAGAGAEPEFELRTTAGDMLSGKLVRFTSESIEIETANGRQSVPADLLASLKPLSPPAALEQKPAVWLELVDGSLVPASSYAVDERRATIKSLAGDETTLPTSAIASVRFNEQTPALATQWAEIAAADRSGDSIVIRKKESLDYQSGVAGDISSDKVQFTIDGESLSVKRSRVEGLFYFHPAGRELGEGFCRLTDVAGGRLEVAAAELADGAIVATTPAGLKLRVELARIASVDGKIQYLSDIQPDSVQWTAYFGETDQPASLKQFYRPRLNESLNGGPLRLGGVEYGKGIALYSGTQAVYRLPPGRYGKLRAIAGIDDRARPGGNAVLKIYGDDKLLFEGALTGRDEPIPVEVDLKGVNRLKLKVEFGGDQEVLDHVDLCDARILK